MRALIPSFISDRYQSQQSQGRFHTAALFVDISGFTALTESLMKHGKEGAEHLTNALNTIFIPLTAAVFAHSGFITTFAGDAFTALFPADNPETLHHTAQTAFLIRDFFSAHPKIETPYGSFSMGVKVGMSSGEVDWGIVGQGEKHTFFFRGEAVDSCAWAEHHAQQGDIIAAPSFIPQLANIATFIPIEDHARLTSLLQTIAPKTQVQPTFTRSELDPFVLDALIDLQTQAEFRDVASVFIAFDAPDETDRLNAFVSQVLVITATYGGYFNKLDFSDKGAVMLILFGAPVAYENNIVRAADFLLALKKTVNDVSWRAGLTVGTVYAGIMGGVERCEYTAIGRVVNLAARLMMAAPAGEIWLGSAASEGLANQGYALSSAGSFTFKGISQSMDVQRLEGGITGKPLEFEGRSFVGRNAELTQLASLIQPIFSGRFAGMIYIHGEAGIGKSRLVYELLIGAPSLKVFTFPVDEVLRQSLNPFRRFLREYFEQTQDKNLARFNQKLDDLIQIANDSNRAEIANELRRTRSILAAQVDLYTEDSLYAQLDPKLRFENTLIAFKQLILAESLRQPLVLHIEDAHWLDDDSQLMIDALTRDVAAYAFALILTSRYQDDGTPFMLDVDPDVVQSQIDLAHLAQTDVAAVAKQILKAEVSSGLATFLYNKTHGNPFFIEQLALYLQERELLQNPDASILDIAQTEIAAVPDSINAVLIARLDRLSAQVKQIVQTAAVLGHEFEVLVLAAMLHEDTRLLEKVRQAENQAIWTALTEIRYLFRHALMRDAAYDMQMRARLRELHLLAAGAIERLYAENLAEHYADLTYHYGCAKDDARERPYARLAGEYAAVQFANSEAIRYLNRALELTPESDSAERFDLHKALEAVCNLQGDRQTQQSHLEALEALLATLDQNERRAEIGMRRANFAFVTGDNAGTIEAAQQIMALPQSDAIAEYTALANRWWGSALLRAGEYAAAQEPLERALALAQKHHLPIIEIDVLRNMGIKEGDQNNHVAALEYYNLSLARAQQIRYRDGEAAALSQIGMVKNRQGEYLASKNAAEQALVICRDIGDRLLETNLLGNLSALFYAQGQLEEAKNYIEQQLRLCNQIGNLYGACIAQTNIAMLVSDLMQTDEALRRYEEALRLTRLIEFKENERRILNGMGMLYQNLGEYSQAKTYLEESLQLRQAANDRGGIAESLANLAYLEVKLGRYDSAENLAQQALALFNEINYPYGKSNILSFLGMIANLTGDYALAQAYCQQGLTIANEIQRPSEQALALSELAFALNRLAQPEEALAYYRQSFEIYHQLNQRYYEIEVLAGIATCLLTLNQLDEALMEVELILGDLHTTPTNIMYEPIRVYLTVYYVLKAVRDSRAEEILKQGYELLHQNAANTPDEDSRRSYLEAVPHHRELIALWTTLQT